MTTFDGFFIFYPPVSRKCPIGAIHWTNPDSLRVAFVFEFSGQVLVLASLFATCQITLNGDNYREASFPRTQQRGLGGS